MQCSNFQRKISDYIGKRLPEREAGGFLDHASLCPECRRLLEEEERLTTLLNSVPATPLPAGLESRILAALPRRARHVSMTPPLWWTTASRGFRAAAVVVLMVGLTLGALLGRGLNQASSAGDVNAVTYYGLDQFSEAPDGTLAAAYLSLVTADASEGR